MNFKKTNKELINEKTNKDFLNKQPIKFLKIAIFIILVNMFSVDFYLHSLNIKIFSDVLYVIAGIYTFFLVTFGNVKGGDVAVILLVLPLNFWYMPKLLAYK